MTNSNPTWTEIQPGDTADADIIMDNFLYLRNLVTANGQSIANKESISNKNTAGGYCGLDNTGQVPNARLSTFKQGIDSQISTLSSQISSISGQITNLDNNKLSATKNGGGKGYIKFSNNITIQWGTAAFAGNKSSVTISLLVPFSDTSYRVTSGISTTNEDGNEQNWIRITDINQSSFKLTKYDKGTVHWIAIGG